MKRDISVLFIAVMVVGGISGTASVARAYEMPAAGQLPVPAAFAATTTASSTYDFGSSFGNLVSPFTDFFNSIQGNNIKAPTLQIGGATSTISISINFQQYLNQYVSQFDMWFYQKTGVQIDWLLRIFINVVYWAINLANFAVKWIVSLFH